MVQTYALTITQSYEHTPVDQLRRSLEQHKYFSAGSLDNLLFQGFADDTQRPKKRTLLRRGTISPQYPFIVAHTWESVERRGTGDESLFVDVRYRDPIRSGTTRSRHPTIAVYNRSAFTPDQRGAERIGHTTGRVHRFKNQDQKLDALIAIINLNLEI